MRRGTTPTHTFTTDIDLSSAEVIYITYTQSGVTRLEKDIDDLTVTDEDVSFTLTQEETLAFNPLAAVSVQIRARFSDGTAVASNIISASVEAILKDGEI